ncbi:hypothetical protein lbkm_0045 [Lachnospiraceae bacterium KM106-2]|nr:hypothetical protein lbkm_0045 [Lachnospiraceae bacterium KM106-2]
MKRSAALLKNIAALIMLLALISLLLPFCKVQTGGKTTTVSGLEVIKISASTGYHYYSKGDIPNSYVLKDNLTWGDLKTGLNYASQNNELWKIELGAAVLILPALLCFFAMIGTFMAEGKKTMLLPTIFLILAVAENVLIILGFSDVMRMILSYAAKKGMAGTPAVTLLIGIYAFTVLCGIALAIILYLWLTGGFRKPRRRDLESDYYDDDDDDGRKKKDRSSGRDKRRKKRRRKKKSRRKKEKRSKDKTNDKDTEKKKDQKDDQKEQDNQKDGKEEEQVSEALGHLTGMTGMYQGANIDLSQYGAGTFTIGTTPEAMNALLNGSLRDATKLDGNNCVINYSHARKQFTITSHSDKNIILETGDSIKNKQILGNGETKTVGKNTVLYIGDLNNAIKLD